MRKRLAVLAVAAVLGAFGSAAAGAQTAPRCYTNAEARNYGGTICINNVPR